MKREVKVTLRSTLFLCLLFVVLAPTIQGLNREAFAANSNSQEVEQLFEQSNQNCNTAIDCANLLLAQVLVAPAAVITNVGNLKDTSNSAEV